LARPADHPARRADPGHRCRGEVRGVSSDPRPGQSRQGDRGGFERGRRADAALRPDRRAVGGPSGPGLRPWRVVARAPARRSVPGLLGIARARRRDAFMTTEPTSTPTSTSTPTPATPGDRTPPWTGSRFSGLADILGMLIVLGSLVLLFGLLSHHF